MHEYGHCVCDSLVLHSRGGFANLGFTFVSGLAWLCQLTELLFHAASFFRRFRPHLFLELLISCLWCDALLADLVGVDGCDVEWSCLVASRGRELVPS